MNAPLQIFVFLFSITSSFLPAYAEHRATIHLEHHYNKSFTESKSHHNYFHYSSGSGFRKNFRTNSSNAHQSRLNKYTAQEFRDYFTHHDYTEKEILQERCLYMSDEFVKLAQTYSSYKSVIQQLHDELKQLNIAQKAYRIVKGTYCTGLQKRIQYLYDQLSTLKNEPCTSKELMVKDHSIDTFPECRAEYKALHSIYCDYASSLSKAIEKRIEAYNNLAGTDGYLHYVDRSYNLNNNIEQLLNKYGHDAASFAQCYGHKLHHAIHQESLDLLSHIDDLPSHSILYDHQEALVDFTAAMVGYNRENYTDKAMQIGDFCWALLDYGQAIAEGVALGAYAAVVDIFNNPIEATISIVAGRHIVAYQLCKVLYNVADIGITALVDAEHAKDKWNTYIEPLNNLIDAINNKELSLRNVLKNGTALAVGLKTQSTLLGGLVKFCGTIRQKSVNFAKSNSLFDPQEYLTTPEGLLFKATVKSDKLKQSGQIAIPDLKNSIDDIKKLTSKKANELAQKLKFKKTNYYSHGQPVFKKGNLYITPDIDGHNGGVWKMATSLENLNSKKTRLGTYDINLNRIGD